MELIHDWKRFQDAFYGPSRRRAAEAGARVEPIYLVVDGDTIISVLCENEDWSDWLGVSFAGIAEQFPHRELIAFDRSQIDKAMEASLHATHFYDQVEILKQRALPSSTLSRMPSSGRFSKNAVLPVGRGEHFLLSALKSWWAKVLPSHFGIYIRLEKQNGNLDQDFLMIFKKGRFEGFVKPDLISLGSGRANEPGAVVKYLSEKHLVKVQSFTAYSEDWERWSSGVNPWNEIAMAVKSNRIRMVPFKWGLAVLFSIRGIFGF